MYIIKMAVETNKQMAKALRREVTELNQDFRRINLSPGCKMASGKEGGLMVRTSGVKVLDSAGQRFRESDH